MPDPRESERKGAPPRVTLGHGAGGRLTSELVRELFLARFRNPHLEPLGDSAVVAEPGGGALVLTTDGYVVTPLFFPGGDIGRLAVCGTVNDLAVAGARPLYLTASFIIEEGLPLAELERVVDSMARTAREAAVEVVAGDTKVVESGSCDKLFIVTAGVGCLRPGADLGPDRVRPGDRLVINGPVGLHGVAVLSQREGLSFQTTVRSDCGLVSGPAALLVERLGPAVRWMRDPTRGGLATLVCDLAEDAGVPVIIDEESVPVPPDVEAACELLGLDPLYLANEGKLVAVVEAEAASEAVRLLREAGCPEAAEIGRVSPSGPAGPGPTRPRGYLRTRYGGTRLLERLDGDQLPRIC